MTVATIHGAEFMQFAKRYPWLVSAVLRRAVLVTCLDRQTLDFVALHAPGVRCELVPNPVLVEDASPTDATDELVVFAGEIGRARAPTSCIARGLSWLGDARGRGA